MSSFSALFRLFKDVLLLVLLSLVVVYFQAHPQQLEKFVSQTVERVSDVYCRPCFPEMCADGWAGHACNVPKKEMTRSAF